MAELGFHKALIAVWDVIGKVNKYIDTMAPWVLAKSDRDRLSTVIFHIIETLKIISVLLWPFMPESAERMQEQLGYSKKCRAISLEQLREWGKERPTNPITKAPALFPRIEAEKEKGEDRKVAKTKGPETEAPLISFQEFQKMDLRVGTITGAEAIEGSKKLLKLTVDVGGERTLVAGLKGHYSEEDLKGKQVVVMANLEPAKLMGVVSHGMVLAVEDQSGVHLLVPDADTLPGSKVT
jgi:methionyl-tRNA synthetase